MIYTDAFYGRVARMRPLENVECSFCHRKKDCLGWDNSDGEYGEIAVCEDCLNRAWS